MHDPTAAQGSGVKRDGGTPFRSILFDDEAPGDQIHPGPPPYLADLNLDQVIASITAGREGYDLVPFFHAPLRSVDSIAYRHQVLRDLENPALFDQVASFAGAMRAMRSRLAQMERLRHRHQQAAWFLDAVDVHCEAVVRLTNGLAGIGLRARGWRAFRDYVADYAGSDAFKSLRAETKQRQEELAGVRYCLTIGGSQVKVGRYDSEVDYGEDVERT